MERPTGPPLGAATLSSGRNGLPRPPPSSSANSARRAPGVRHAQSSSSLSAQIPRSEAQVIALAREAMDTALEDNRRKAVDTAAVSNELRPGVTIDLSHKQIQKFPDEVVDIIKNELERLALSHNQISSFPARFAECTSLRYLNVRNNVIREFPQPEGEMDDITVTTQIKRFLKQKAMMDRSETESGGEESSEGTETPRPLKRVVSGRFPIRVDVPGSPAQTRPPPIPSRSHQRGFSQQNAALRRPGVMPLTIGSTNERLRSNSESLLQANRDRADRADRSRRMGIVSKKAAELGTVEETNKTNRYSQHLRGLSHGSAMQGAVNGTNGNSVSPASPAESAGQRATYVRRLSSLPERKRESTSPDPIIEGAKGILYALFQVHPLIETLLGLARNPGEKKPSLERVFYNVKTHVEELDRDVQHYDTYSEEDEEISPRSNENVKRACLTCVNAYIHVCALLSQNVETLLINGDPRYIRTLLLQLYGSVAEVRNAGASLFPPGQRIGRRAPSPNHDTVRYHSRDKSITPTRERPGTSLRMRSTTVIQHSANLRVAIDAPQPPFLNGNGRSATMTSATPRSGESFASNGTSGRMGGGDFTEEDRIFERIFLHLQQSSEMAIRTLPTVSSHFVTALSTDTQQSRPGQPKPFWNILIRKCTHALFTADALKSRLSQIKLKEPGVRTQAAFWELCTAFIDAYTDLVIKVKEAKGVTSLLPTDVIYLLRPLQKAVKEAGQLMQTSPWSYLAGRHVSNHTSNGSYTTQSPALQIPLPMTPQSAALGPAVQATVPSTPQSASFGGMFSGNSFDRSDTMLSMGQSTRANTMTSTLGVVDGSMNSMLSPLNGMGGRYYGNGKVAF
ncbi:RAM signaling pathway protein [Rutstroemia sp. NJR-2017a BBW]|nr:RAM signaling pathway protein [Rutstroemia sp. NJR-2017a BBW]